MSWRTVIVKNRCKLSYKNDYMLITSDGNEKTLHISEIGTLIIENTAVNLTAYLLCELSRYKVKVIFCDHQRNPYGEIIPYYGSHNVSKQMSKQSQWSQSAKNSLWKTIVAQKIIKQAQTIYRETGNSSACEALMNFAANVSPGDLTNREAHAAKLYFKELFGPKFSRDSSNDINAALNYGYAILLSAFNREITAAGYSTTIGVNHCNEYNPFNLTCDLMESFRPIVDSEVYKCRNFAFDDFFKSRLIEILNHKVVILGKEQFLSNAISIYVKLFFRTMETGDDELPEYELI